MGNRGIRESWNPGIGESGNRGIRESGNPGIGESRTDKTGILVCLLENALATVYNANQLSYDISWIIITALCTCICDFNNI